MVPMTWLDNPNPDAAEERRQDAEERMTERLRECPVTCEFCYRRVAVVRLTPRGWMCPECDARPVPCDVCGRTFPRAQVKEIDGGLHCGGLHCGGCRGGDRDSEGEVAA